MKYIYFVFLVIFIAGCSNNVNVIDNFDYYFCTDDDDCLITSTPVEGCCSQCEEFSINKEGFERQKSWRSENCGSNIENCPVYDCFIDELANPRCINGKCEIEWSDRP